MSDRIVPVSTVIPTYNRRGKVRRAINSVLAQTVLPSEIIVVDDGSSDGTAEQLHQIYGDRVRVISQKNAGVAAARNTGVSAASHELIAFLDSDDVWQPRKLELQLPLMTDDVVLCYTNWAYFNDPEAGFAAQPRGVIDRPLQVLTSADSGGLLIVTSLVRKSALKRVGGFDERLRIAEDTRAFFRLALEGKFARCSEVLALWDLHDGGDHLTCRQDESYRRDHADAVVEILSETYARIGEYPKDEQAMVRKLLGHFMSQQARQFALQSKDAQARRKAFESLAFQFGGRSAMRAFLTVLWPGLQRRYATKNGSKTA